MKLKIDSRSMPLVATGLVFILLYLAGSIIFPGFFSLRVLFDLFNDNAFLGISAVGMTFVILSGGIDLSVGSMIAFSGMLTATLVENAHFNPALTIPIVLIAGGLIGLAQGAIIQFFSAPPFIVTLGGMFFARGMAQVISLDSIPINDEFFGSFTRIGLQLGDGLLAMTSLIFLAVVALAIFITRMTGFGRNVYAIGGSASSAILMGLPVARTRVSVYAINGLLSGLAGVVYTMYTSAGYSLSGVGMEMDAISAVVIGGTLISGGVGFIEGTLIGVLIIGIIQTFITFQGSLSSHWTRIFIATLVFAFIILQRSLSKISSRLAGGSGK